MTRRRLHATAASALLLAACGDVGGPVDTGPQRVFTASGQVHALSGTLPAGLRVTVRAGTVSSSAAVAPNGSFHVQATLPDEVVDVIIDTPGQTRSTLPALLRVTSQGPLTNVSVLLVPARWTISGGTFHGQSVDVSLDAAFRPPCGNADDINCDGFYPRVWFTGPKLWAPSALPVPVAFDHARSHQNISAADSVAFWSIVSRMNDDAGMNLFRAARVTEVPVNAAGNPTSGVLIRVDTTLAGFGAWTNWWWNASGNLYAGLVRPRTVSGVRSGGLMTHELLHTQGIKHSCSWTTVMSGYGSPCGTSNTLSRNDVAYLQLAFALHERQRATGAQHGLIAALQGERVLLRGLDPYMPAALQQLRLLSADSIGHGDHAH